MKFKRSLQVALLGAVLVTRALAQTEADIASLLPKAQRGNAIAQYNLGLAYLNGKGVTLDRVEAYVWLSLAHEGGFRGKALTVVAAGLEPAEFEAARQRLAERRATLNLKTPPAPAKTETAEAAMPVVRTDAPPSPAPAPAQNSSLTQELASAVADKQQLSDELSKSWAETEELKKQLASNQSTTDLLTAQISKLNGERDGLASKLNALTAEAATIRKDRDSARALGAQAEAALAQANTQKASLESSIKEVQASTATDKKWMSDELAKSFQEVSALQSQLAAAATTAAAVASAAPAYPDLSSKVKELEANLAATTAEAMSAKQEAKRLADDRIEREKQLLAVQQQSAESANARATLQQEIESFRRAAATPVAPAYPDLREEVAALKSAADQTEQTIAALTQAKETAEKNLAQKPAAPSYPNLSSRVTELETLLVAVTADAKSAHQEVRNLQRAAATPVAPAYPDLREEVAALKSAADQTEQTIAALTQAKETAEKNLAQKPAAPSYPNLSSKVAELEASLAAVTADAQSAQQEVRNLQRAAATPVAPAYPDLREQVAALKSAAGQTEQTIAALTQAKETAEKNLAQKPTAPSYPNLSSRVTELEASLAAVTADAKSAQQEVRNLQRAAATPVAPAYPDLREQVAALESQIATLRSEGARTRDQIAGLTLAKAAAEKSLAQVPAAPTYPNLSGKVQELEASLAALSAKATAAQEEATRLADERIEREKQLLAVEQQSAELSAARDSLQQEIGTLRSAAAAPVAPVYPDLRGQVTALESQLAAAKTEAGQQTAALAEARTTLENISRAAPAAPAYPDLSDRVKELEGALAARSADSTNADELAQAKADAAQKLAAAEQSRAELAQQFDEFKRSALASQRESLNRQAQITMLEAEKAALRQQSTADQTRLAELSSQLTASRRKAEEVYPTAPAYPDQRARVEQLEAELTRTNEQANGMIAVLNRSQQEAKVVAEQTEQLRATIRELENRAAATAPVYPDLREQVSNLEIQLEAARALPKNHVSPTEFATLKQELSDTKQKLATTLQGYALIEQERDALANRPAPAPVVAAPEYPDLREKVASLETALNAARSAGPAYPDLREQVGNLEIQLEAARSLPKDFISPKEISDLKQELADTQEKLATTLKGYRMIEKERDELAASPDRVGSTSSDVARLTEAYNALQRVNAQNERDLVLLRAQVQQGPASTSIAQQPTPARVAPVPVAPRIVAGPATPPASVVAAPAAPAVRRTHIVAAGDTLVKISQRYYGTTNNWQPIYDANRELLGPKGTLKVGTELRIP